MNPNQTDNEDNMTNPFIGLVSSKTLNLFTGQKEELKGKYSLPLATDLQSLNSLVQGNESDILFWINFGRKVAARSQDNARLEFDLGSDELNDKYSAFDSALKSMVDDKTTPERRQRVIDFILGEPKFAELKDALANREIGEIFVDFAEVELKKPSGKRGRQKKESDSDSD
jgi:hypothetical protein